MKSSNMSEKNGAVSSRGMQASPAVGAKCVKSSGSSFNTRNDKEKLLGKIFAKLNNQRKNSKSAKNYETLFDRARANKEREVLSAFADLELTGK